MLSNSAKYALKAVLFLAIHSNEENRVMVKDIAQPINVPQAYIAKLLQELSKQDLISSARGINGGFYLTELNLKQPIIEVIYAIDGRHKLHSCLLSLDNCHEHFPCPLHFLANPMRSNLVASLNSKTIEDLASEITSGSTFLPL